VIKDKDIDILNGLLNLLSLSLFIVFLRIYIVIREEFPLPFAPFSFLQCIRKNVVRKYTAKKKLLKEV
jgi:hypothetical protein